jgi:phosphate transport system substrate-binding protein
MRVNIIRTAMLRFSLFVAGILISAFLFFCPASAFSFSIPKRSHIQVVGSSTVYPFMATIAETFGRDSGFKTPVVESTGTGGGFKLFCSGVGYKYPDFNDASRPIQPSELKKCAENGIEAVVKIKIGYDGIVLANSIIGAKHSFTKKQIFLALAQRVPSKDKAGNKSSTKLIQNPYQKWSDIDPALPAIPIIIYGAPTTSGTRDTFAELVMEDACVNLQEFIAAYPDLKNRAKQCHIIRSDGKFIEAGENANLIIQKLKNNPDALGIFGFSFLEENRNIIQSVKISNVDPTFDNIVSGLYPVSRPLFIYFKKEHLNLIPGFREFVQEIISKNTVGSDGYLLQKGLIPLTDLEIKKVRAEVTDSLK